MRQVQVGDTIIDNDPRMRDRKLTIVRLWFPLSGTEGAKAIVRERNREYSILLRRIHTDGKARKSGFSLVQSMPKVDRTNGYPLTFIPTATYCWGLFVPASRDRMQWVENFFFKTRKDALTHGRNTFRVFAVGKVQS